MNPFSGIVLVVKTIASRALLPLVCCFGITGSSPGDDFVWELNAPTTNWDIALNWAGTPNQFPNDNTDSATVTVNSLSGVAPVLTVNRVIGALTLSGDGDLDTNNFALTVQASLSQDGTTTIENSNSTLTVRQSPALNDFDSDNLIINSGGDLRLLSGARVQVDAVMENNSGGIILGNGIMEINGSDDAENSGTVSADGGTLTVQRTGSAFLDLDGTSENGILRSQIGSTLIIDMPITGPAFDGVVQVFGGEVQINDNWELEPTPGTLLTFDPEFLGDTTATLSGTNFTLSGQAEILSGTAILAVPTLVTNTGTLTVGQGTTLQIDAPTAIDDADSFINEFDTTLIVNELVDILNPGSHFDWDGMGQNGQVRHATIVNSNGYLRIQVASVDEPGLDENVTTDITMNGGRISISNDDEQWQLDGTLTMNTSNDTPFLTNFGLQHDTVTFLRDVSITGTGRAVLEMDSVFASSSSVDVEADAIFGIGHVFEDTRTVFEGGDWTGGGAISLDAEPASITAATTVNMPGGTFDVDGDFGHGNLIVNAPFILNVASVEQNDGLDTNRIDDPIEVNSNGRLEVHLTNPALSYTINSDLDLNALGGGLASLHLSGSGVELGGTTQVSGNSIIQARADLTGDFNLAAGSTFRLSGGTIADPNAVFAEATFIGNGDLIVSQNRALQIEDNAAIGVDLENRGRLEPGFSIGTVDFTDFQQTNSGTLEIEFSGSPVVDHDLLNVSGTALLDGQLIVKIIETGQGIFAPQIGDEFTILTAFDGLDGQFDNEPISVGDGEGYQWEVLYNDSDVTIRVASIIPDLFLGDVNGDGSVDLLDVAPFVDALNSATYIVQADVNCDGFVNLLDVALFIELLTG